MSGRAPEPVPACYVYGVLPSSAPLPAQVRGIGSPPTAVRMLPHGDLAVLVSDVAQVGEVACPTAVVAHQQLLDAVALNAPVLPLRFGTVVPDPEAVVDELLVRRAAQVRTALSLLAGRTQYLVKGRYVPDRVLAEVLARTPRARQLRDRLERTRTPGPRQDLRLGLGRVIGDALAARRSADGATLARILLPCCVACSGREPVHPYDAVNVALLVENRRGEDVERLVDVLACEWRGRIEVSLRGPMAGYDFARLDPVG